MKYVNIGNAVLITHCVSPLCPLDVTTAIEDGADTEVMPWITTSLPHRQKAVQQTSQIFQ